MTIENDLLEQEEQDLYEHFRIIVDKGQSLLRIEKFLMHRIENASRNRIQNAIEQGNVLVNDKAIKADIITDIAMVMANCWYNRPTMPGINPTGTNTAANIKAIAITGAEISFIAW